MQDKDFSPAASKDCLLTLPQKSGTSQKLKEDSKGARQGVTAKKVAEWENR